MPVKFSLGVFTPQTWQDLRRNVQEKLRQFADQFNIHTGDDDIHFPDAPDDGQTYARQDGEWIAVQGLETVLYISDATADLQPDVAAAWNDYGNRNAIVRTGNQIIYFQWPSTDTDTYQYAGNELGPVWTTTVNQWVPLGGGTEDHSVLINRDAADQHPQSAITDLVADQAAQDTAIAGKVSKTGDVMTGDLSFDTNTIITPAMRFVSQVDDGGFRVLAGDLFAEGTGHLYFLPIAPAQAGNNGSGYQFETRLSNNINFVIFRGNGNVELTATDAPLSNQLTTRQYMEDNTVAKTGDQMSGNLALEYDNPALVFRDTVGTFVEANGTIQWQDSTSTATGLLGFAASNDFFLFDNDKAGAIWRWRSQGAAVMDLYASGFLDLRSTMQITNATGIELEKTSGASPAVQYVNNETGAPSGYVVAAKDFFGANILAHNVRDPSVASGFSWECTDGVTPTVFAADGAGNMTGLRSVTAIEQPVNPQDLTRKDYVDSLVGLELAILYGQCSSFTFNTSSSTLVNYSNSAIVGTAMTLDSAAGTITINETGLYRIVALLVGTQGNDTKEESMYLRIESDFAADTIWAYDVATDKTNVRSFGATFTRGVPAGTALRLSCLATAGMGTFTVSEVTFEISKLTIPEQPETDPFFADVISLLHVDANGTPGFATDVIAGRTWTGANQTTANPRFGAAAHDSLATFKLTSTNMPDIGSSDFTIESWIASVGGAGSQDRYWLDFRDVGGGGSNPDALSAGRFGGVTALDVYLGATLILRSTTNVWDEAYHHVAVCRQGTTIRLYVDGVEEASYTDSPVTAINIASNGFVWGNYSVTAQDIPGLMHMDELRITTAARYTVDFAPPDSAFPDQ